MAHDDHGCREWLGGDKWCPCVKWIWEGDPVADLIEGFPAIIAVDRDPGDVRGCLFVGIVGSRDYPEVKRVLKLIDLLSPAATIVSGGARGVDTVAADYAFQTGREVVECRARIHTPKERTRNSLMNRNTVIVVASGMVVAFWDGRSNGTRDTITKALEIHGYVVVVLPGIKPQMWQFSK